MNLQHLCFISYRHLGDPDAHRFVTAFRDRLRTELCMLVPRASVYFDEERIHPGYTVDNNLASHLCRSATLVMFFTPAYFDVEHYYCALEYKAMCDLEAQRRIAWPSNFADRRLIFPVVFRAEQELPDEVRNACKPLLLPRDLYSPTDFKRKRNCQELVRQLATEIFERYKLLRQHGEGNAHDCSRYAFPKVTAIQPWL